MPQQIFAHFIDGELMGRPATTPEMTLREAVQRSMVNPPVMHHWGLELLLAEFERHGVGEVKQLDVELIWRGYVRSGSTYSEGKIAAARPPEDPAG